MEVPIQGGISASYLLSSEKISSLKFNYLELSFEELHGRPRKFIDHYISQLANDFKFILSSRSLNIGSTDELNYDVLKSIREIEKWLKPEILHDSLSWSALDGHYTFLELPIPFTESNLELLVERVFRIQECLGRKISIRNLPSPLSFVAAEFNQAEFLSELLRITGCGVTLDHAELNLKPYEILPRDGIDLHRIPTGRVPKFSVNRFIAYGSNLDDQLIFLPQVKTATSSSTTERSSLDPIPRSEAELHEGNFESEPRKVLIEEVTRGFGIRPTADVGVFDLQPDPRNGLAFYNQQYFLQVRNVLQSQYRALSFLFSGQFDRITVDFLIHYPPTEASISQVGRDFEVFLREQEGLPPYLADLAKLEFAQVELMEGEEQASIDQGVMMEIESSLWDKVIFKLNDHVRLVEAAYDVAKIQKSVLGKAKIPDNPKPQKTFYLVYRLNNLSCTQLIGRPEAKALTYAWNEMTFLKICERIAAEEGLAQDEVIQQTFSFIHRWAGLGFVKGFEFKSPDEVISFSESPWNHEEA